MMMKKRYIKPTACLVVIGNNGNLMDSPFHTESSYRVVTGNDNGPVNIIDYEGNLNNEGTGTADGQWTFSKGSMENIWDSD